MKTLTTPASKQSGWWTAAGLAMPMLLSALGVSIANIALPALLTEFSATLPEVQWVVLAYLLFATAAIVPAGYLGDQFGRGRVLLAGIALFTAASLACALAPTLPTLIAARAVQGIGAAVLSTLTMSLVRDLSKLQSLGAGMGLLGSMSAIGTTLGPFVGGIVITQFGWPAAFAILVPLGIASFVVVWHILPDQGSGSDKPGRLDVWGALLLAATLAIIALSLSPGALHDVEAIWLFPVMALISGGLFIYVEKRTASPLVSFATLRKPALAASLAGNVLVSAVMMTTLIVGPIFLSAALGLSAAYAGLVISIGPAASMASGLAAGRLADRFGTRRMTLSGLAQIIAGAISLSVLPAAFGVAGYAVSLIILTPGYQLFLAANNAAVVAGAAKHEVGVVSGFLNLSRNLGFIAGASGMGTVFALASATKTTAEAITAATSITYMAATGLALAALAIVIAGTAQSGTQTGAG